ncbi:hypothetical protein VB735_23700 [Halotia wernerae UHCC 0503]|nr:hypothetical protein [Halotia wernerae UHCC 0503]
MGEDRTKGFPPPGDALYETLRERKLALRYANGSPPPDTCGGKPVRSTGSSLLEQQDRATSPSGATSPKGRRYANGG